MWRWIGRNPLFTLAFLTLPAAIFCILTVYNGMPLWIILPAGVAVVLAYVALVHTAMRREWKRVLPLYEDKCDPEPLLEYCDTVLREYNSAANAAYSYRMTRVSALHTLGRYEEAQTALSKMGRPTFDPYLALFYDSATAAMQIDARDFDGLDARLTELEQAVISAELPEAARTGLLNTVELSRCCYDIETGRDSEDLLPRLQGLLEKSPSLRYSVSVQLDLAKYYLQVKHDPHAARPYLEFAAGNGNRMNDAARARELLSEINAPMDTVH